MLVVYRVGKVVMHAWLVFAAAPAVFPDPNLSDYLSGFRGFYHRIAMRYLTYLGTLGSKSGIRKGSGKGSGRGEYPYPDGLIGGFLFLLLLFGVSMVGAGFGIWWCYWCYGSRFVILVCHCHCGWGWGWIWCLVSLKLSLSFDE